MCSQLNLENSSNVTNRRSWWKLLARAAELQGVSADFKSCSSELRACSSDVSRRRIEAKRILPTAFHLTHAVIKRFGGMDDLSFGNFTKQLGERFFVEAVEG
jgi:hypothetical protein